MAIRGAMFASWELGVGSWELGVGSWELCGGVDDVWRWFEIDWINLSKFDVVND